VPMGRRPCHRAIGPPGEAMEELDSPYHRCAGRAELSPTGLVSEREEAVRPQTEFSTVDLSPEKDLQHRLEVLALATDGEERCPMEGCPFQRLQLQVLRRVRLEVALVGSLRSIGLDVTDVSFSSPRRPLAAPAPSLPLPAGGYGSRGRPPDTTGRAVPLTGFPRGFSEEGSRPRIAAAHRPAVGPTSTRTMDQQRLRAQLYTLISHVRQPLAPPS
ncbi:hypothetical protein THAOC_28247, partial [Thalassiosira oceanica]